MLSPFLLAYAPSSPHFHIPKLSFPGPAKNEPPFLKLWKIRLPTPQW